MAPKCRQSSGQSCSPDALAHAQQLSARSFLGIRLRSSQAKGCADVDALATFLGDRDYRCCGSRDLVLMLPCLGARSDALLAHADASGQHARSCRPIKPTSIA